MEKNEFVLAIPVGITLKTLQTLEERNQNIRPSQQALIRVTEPFTTHPLDTTWRRKLASELQRVSLGKSITIELKTTTTRQRDMQHWSFPTDAGKFIQQIKGFLTNFGFQYPEEGKLLKLVTFPAGQLRDNDSINVSILAAIALFIYHIQNYCFSDQYVGKQPIFIGNTAYDPNMLQIYPAGLGAYPTSQGTHDTPLYFFPFGDDGVNTPRKTSQKPTNFLSTDRLQACQLDWEEW